MYLSSLYYIPELQSDKVQTNNNRMQNPLIYWFRQDLRLHDNAALTAAIKTGKPIIAIYILDQNPKNKWSLGSASQWWLHHSLLELNHSLSELGSKLVLRSGNVEQVLSSLVTETHADTLYFARQYEPYAASLENKINKRFGNDIEIKRFKGYLLHEPESIRTGSNHPYKVFTPFYKNCLNTLKFSNPISAPKQINPFKKKVTSELLNKWNLLPTQPNWARQFAESWLPGENGAHQTLNKFIMGSCSKYSVLRNRPDVTGTSKLSAHLHFGEISPRQVWTSIKSSQDLLPEAGEPYLRQLIWREFSYHLLTHWPSFPNQPFRSEFKEFAWKRNNKALIAWQKGRTGYPIVDAGMRELWKTGWMHNRVRMIVASFLIKDLMIPWQQGEKWFWDTLLDADLANNAAGWQWVAGCGADAAPYFRIFNPVTQGEKFDPEGDYVRTWIPEIRKLPKKYIHAPWLASQDVLEKANIKLGKNYPYPIVNHKQARENALNAFKDLKSITA